jgi:hypothetical protein
MTYVVMCNVLFYKNQNYIRLPALPKILVFFTKFIKIYVLLVHIVIFWVMTRYSLVGEYQYFDGMLKLFRNLPHERWNRKMGQTLVSLFYKFCTKIHIM